MYAMAGTFASNQHVVSRRLVVRVCLIAALSVISINRASVAGDGGAGGLLLERQTTGVPHVDVASAPQEGSERLLLADRRDFRDRPSDEFWFKSALTAIEQRDAATFNDPVLAFSRLELTSFPSAPVPLRLPPEDFSELDEDLPHFSVSGLVADQQRSVVGGRVQLLVSKTDRGRMLAETRMTWLCEFLQNPVAGPVFFAPGDKAVYAVQGLHYGNNWLIVGKAMRWELLGGLSAFAGYDAQINSQQMFHFGSGGLAFGW